MHRKREGRRGMSHLEAVLSFIIFIAFLSFAFYFFSPFRGSTVLDTTLIYAEDEIIKNASSEVETYSVVFESSVSQPVKISLLPSSQSSKVRAENYEGQPLPASVYSGGVSVNPSGNDFVRIIFSENIIENPEPDTMSTSPYTLASSETREILNENKMSQLVASYESNYAALKKEFNLPSRVDFTFTLTFDDGTALKAENEIPGGVEVISKESRIEVIRNNGEIVLADLIIKVL